jgi:predicted PurR-regulated permease PerM
MYCLRKIMLAGQKQQARDSVRLHRQNVRWRILMPFLLGIVLITACAVIIMLFPRRLQVALVSDFMITLFMLCPAAICMLPITLLMIAAAFGMNRVHDGLVRPLNRLQDASESIQNSTTAASDMLNQRTVDLSARLGVLYRLLDIFDQPDAANDEAQNE